MVLVNFGMHSLSTASSLKIAMRLTTARFKTNTTMDAQMDTSDFDIYTKIAHNIFAFPSICHPPEPVSQQNVTQTCASAVLCVLMWKFLSLIRVISEHSV